LLYNASNYEMLSSSMYINNNAILRPGNIMPTNGTKIDGK